MRDRTVLLALQLAMSWMVQGSNPGECEIFHTCPAQPQGPVYFLYKEHCISFLEVK
jgi:hypothetical protein